MTQAEDRIPIVETYRGVGIHDQQPRERIDGVVKPAIDRVLGIGDVKRLADYAADTGNPPEARLLASARVEAMWELAAENRELRPGIDLAVVKASVAGLQSVRWRSSQYYGSLLDKPDGPGLRRQEKRKTLVPRVFT
ncbi:hypothetical protein [Devosia sp. XK-2]|uniref:hypothetical protein n=1 Tax=Devosia sp. XK-2 TaxID=3126689 RepID=UPI0030CFF46D